MSDVSGAAPAAAEPAPAPAAAEPKGEPRAAPEKSSRSAVDSAFSQLGLDEAQPPRPLSSTTQPVEKAEAKPKSSAEKPAAASKAAVPTSDTAKNTSTKADTKPAAAAEAAKAAPTRTPTGQYAPKAGGPEGAETGAADGVTPSGAAPKSSAFPEPPRRFSEDAKAAWNDAPEPVRAEIHRATKEMEQGLQKYRESAEAFEPLKPFHQMAQQSGTTLPEAMQKYVAIEQKLRTDFVGGLDELCRNRGITLRGLAERILQQPQNQQAAQQDKITAGLHREIQELKQQLSGVTKSIEGEKTEKILTGVQGFAQEPGHERFEELADDIAKLLKAGLANDLAEAYEQAERIRPAHARSPALPADTSPGASAAQTRKGTLAINGAPSSGSDPATRKPPKTTRAAVDSAFAELGLG